MGAIGRDFIGDYIKIDGRMIQYQLITAGDYMEAKHGYDVEKLDDFVENHYEIYERLNQIMALKQSCFLLRRTSHSDGSLSNDLYNLKDRLIRELRETFNFEFDDQFVEDYSY